MGRQSRNKKVTQQPLPVTRGSSAWRWLIPIFCVVVVGVGSWAATEHFIFNKVPGQLVGKWVVLGGDQDGATFDFYRSGVMEGRINVGGKEGRISARVHVEGKNLFSTTTNPNTGQ